MNVALLEFPDEVDAIAGADNVVALWPNVQVVLRRKGIAYRDTRPFFDNESHKRIILTSEEWLRKVESRLDVSDGSVSFNSVVTFHLRFYFNYFLWIVEILDGMRRELRELSCVRSVARAGPSSPSMTPSDRFVSDIARLYAKSHGLEFVCVRHETTPHRAPSVDLLRIPASILNRISLARVPGGPKILVNDISYNMGRLIRELKPQLPHVKWVWLQTENIPSALAAHRTLKHEPADHYVALSTIRRPANVSIKGLDVDFHYSGVSFKEVFQAKIDRDLIPYVRKLAVNSQGLRYALEKIRPSLVLVPFAAGTDAVLGEWTRKLNIPSMSISHGTFTPSETVEDHIEKTRLGKTLILTSYHHTALQTPLAERFMSGLNGTQAPAPVRTGNLILAKTDAKVRAETRKELFGDAAESMKLIVYATTLKARSGLRFQIHETLDEHLEGIADLSKAIASVERATLLVKLHPAAALKENEVLELVPETRSDRVRVACRMPFQKALSAADLLVSYSSTSIEEAILNRIPVLLYDPWKRYQHLPAYRWGANREVRPSPAYYVNDSRFLAESLSWILMNHDPRRITDETWREYIFPEDTRDEFLRFISNSVSKGEE